MFRRLCGNWRRRGAVIVMAAVGFALVSAPITHAKTISDMSPKEQALSYSYVRMMQTCIASGGYMDGIWNDRINDENAKSYKFFTNNGMGTYHSGMLAGEKIATLGGVVNKGAIDCSDSTWVKNALSLWGYSNPLDFLCGVDGGKEGIGAARTDGQDCRQGGNPFQPFDIGNFTRVISDGVYGGGDILQLGPEAQYVLNLTSFNSLCASTPAQPGIDPNNEWLHTGVQVVQADGTIKDVDYLSSTKKRTDTVQYDGDSSVTCEELKNRVNASAGDYALWAENNKEAAAAQGPVGQEDSGDKPPTPASTCAVESIGWLVCPTVNFLSKIADNAFAFLSDSILKLEPGLVSTSSGTYTAWTSMRNIANAAFIVFFIIIIYSQMTGAGITNYGLKKLLPKLIISAILVNISFFICQVAVDLSNIFGKNIGTIFDSIATPISQTPNDLFDSSANTGDGGFLGFAGIAISVLAAGAAVYFMLPFLFGAVLAAIVSLISVGFILVARKAIIVLLVAIAPLAFVAYLLPNTEALYKKWFKIFTSMLMLFPIVGLLFGAGRLASAVLHSVGGGQAMQIIASVANVIPLFATWTLLKGSMNALGGVGAKINSGTSKLSGMARKKGNDMTDKSRVGQFAKFRAAEREKERKLRQGGVYSGRNPYKKVTAALNRGFNNLPISGKFGDRANASALAFEKDEFEKDVKAAAETQEGMTANDYMALATAKEGAIVQTQKGKMRATREQKTAASDQIMANGSFDNRNALRLHNVKNGDTASLSRVIKQSYAKQDQNILGKDFGDKLLLGHYGKEGGITNEAELLKHAVENVQKGSLQPEHLVQSGGATSWLSGGIKASGNEEAENNFRSAAQAARNSQNTSKNIDSTTDKIFTNDWGIPK